MTRYVLLILAPLLLGGCVSTEFLARAITDATYLHVRAGEYVRGVHDLREFIREECQASLVREVEALKRAGDESALRKMLAESYPPLVTVGMFKSSEGILSKAPGCE